MVVSPFIRGVIRSTRFRWANGLPPVEIKSIPADQWYVSSCAYYRPDTGIMVCVPKCARPATESQVRNWNWPGSTTDREPYGVVCHEMGHYVDMLVSERKGSYYGDYSIGVRKESGESPITSYCPNDAEWFAEMFRLFLTNAYLLKELRPRTFAILRSRWTPVSDEDWETELGPGVPGRVLSNLRKKIAQ